MKLSEAHKGGTTILKNGMDNIEKSKSYFHPDFRKMQLCIIPMNSGNDRWVESDKVIDGFYAIINYPDNSDFDLTGSRTFSLKELLSKDWEICLMEIPKESNTWKYQYYNLKYHYFSSDHSKIWKNFRGSVK